MSLTDLLDESSGFGVLKACWKARGVSHNFIFLAGRGWRFLGYGYRVVPDDLLCSRNERLRITRSCAYPSDVTISEGYPPACEAALLCRFPGVVENSSDGWLIRVSGYRSDNWGTGRCTGSSYAIDTVRLGNWRLRGKIFCFHAVYKASAGTPWLLEMNRAICSGKHRSRPGEEIPANPKVLQPDSRTRAEIRSVRRQVGLPQQR